jgi:hypothetical protein
MKLIKAQFVKSKMVNVGVIYDLNLGGYFELQS